MGYISSLLKSPKKEEQQVPDTTNPNEEEEDVDDDDDDDVMHELQCIWGNLDDDHEVKSSQQNIHSSVNNNWDFMDWENFSIPNDQEINSYEDDDEEEGRKLRKLLFFEQEHNRENDLSKNKVVIKEENNNYLDIEEDRNGCLNLNLNYEEVMNAWSALCSHQYSSMINNGFYRGEVPILEEDRTRREASVLRYKEKRQTRLFSKKIRYQVRKLNADKRPRLKGRFVKRVC